MTQLEKPPFWLVSIITIGIVRAAWISGANRRLNQGGAGFLFAWFFMPFAQFGLAKRLTAALQASGSATRVSPGVCFWLFGWPWFGANHQLKRGVRTLNSALVAQPPVA